MNEQPKPVCPKCGSNQLVVRIGNAQHCNGCGSTVNEMRDPIGEAARQRRAIGFTGWKREPK